MIMLALLRENRKHKKAFDELKDESRTEEEYVHTQMLDGWGFLIEDYHPRYYYFEVIDLVSSWWSTSLCSILLSAARTLCSMPACTLTRRYLQVKKLLLTGLLLFMDRGSVSQVFFGAIFSLIFFTLHLRTFPYALEARRCGERHDYKGAGRLA